MTKQKSTFFYSAMFGICMLSIIFATGCNDEKKSSTETTVTDTSSMSTPASTIDTMTVPIDTGGIDTATTRPIVPGT